MKRSFTGLSDNFDPKNDLSLAIIALQAPGESVVDINREHNTFFSFNIDNL